MKVVFVFHTLRRIVVLGIFLSSLTGCFSNKSAVNEEKERATKVAKINVQLGMAYLENNNIQRAKQKLLLALRQGPTIPETWYTMAYFYEATGDKQQAGVYYLKAIAVAPQRGDAQNNYGTFLCRSGEYRASVQHFMLAVKDPEYLDVAGAYENAGLCALKIPDNKLAIQYLQMAVRQDPNRPLVLLKLAETYSKVGNYTAAKNKLNEFLAVSRPTTESIRLAGQLEARQAPAHLPTEKDYLLSAKKKIIRDQPVSTVRGKGHGAIGATHT